MFICKKPERNLGTRARKADRYPFEKTQSYKSFTANSKPNTAQQTRIHTYIKPDANDNKKGLCVSVGFYGTMPRKQPPKAQHRKS